jgi:hypothetical protein
VLGPPCAAKEEKPSEEEEQNLDASTPSPHDATTPPPRQHAAQPQLAAGKPRRPLISLCRRARHGREGDDGPKPLDLDPVAAWAMHATVAMQAWPATGPCLFFFLFFPRHLESPLGPAHLGAPARPNSFPPF